MAGRDRHLAENIIPENRRTVIYLAWLQKLHSEGLPTQAPGPATAPVSATLDELADLILKRGNKAEKKDPSLEPHMFGNCYSRYRTRRTSEIREGNARFSLDETEEHEYSVAGRFSEGKVRHVHSQILRVSADENVLYEAMRTEETDHTPTDRETPAAWIVVKAPSVERFFQTYLNGVLKSPLT